MNTRIPNPVVNKTGYAYFEGNPNTNPRHELKVTFILDPVPGVCHQPEDTMKIIAQHPYVDTVEYIDPLNSPSIQKLEKEIDKINSVLNSGISMSEGLAFERRINAIKYAIALLREV